MKRHLQCAEPVKWNTMRGTTSVILQLHQILRLPRKMSLRIDPAHIWNVIYHAWSNSTHLPTSPNNAPATENDTHDWSCSHMKRHLQCAEQQHSPSNLTKYCACHAKWHSKIWRKSTENGWSVIYNARPTMIRAWNCKTEPACSWSLLFSLGNAFNFVLKITTFRALAIYPNFTKILRLPRKVTVHDHQTLCLPRTVTLRHHQILCLPRKVAQQHHHMLRLPRKVTMQRHQILCLPRRVTELLLSWTVISADLLLYWAVTFLSCYFTELLLYCYFTEL